MSSENQLIIFEDGKARVEVKLNGDTIWLTQRQIANIFGVEVPAVSRHIRNILNDQELDRSTISKMETVQEEGTRQIKRNVEHYSLDMVIAVGYRVNSKRATSFRIWATNVLKQHMTQGYTISRQHYEQNLSNLKQAIQLLSATRNRSDITEDDTAGLLDVILRYADTWTMLQQFDDRTLRPAPGTKSELVLDYTWAHKALGDLKHVLMHKGEASEFFGVDPEDKLRAIMGNIYQSAGGEDAYPNVELKAAHLLYFVVKDHPFTDGNKRSASYLFAAFLHEHGLLGAGFSKIALGALSLVIAQSNPGDKDLVLAFVTNSIEQSKIEND
jgi:prophage antirepressor-like protein